MMAPLLSCHLARGWTTAGREGKKQGCNQVAKQASKEEHGDAGGETVRLTKVG